MTEVNIDELLAAVEDMHRCKASSAQSVQVSEQYKGKPVWEGVVRVFEIVGHPEATRCYAWSSPVESSSKRRFYAVLEIPPVQSAQDAVRAAIVAEHKTGDN